MKSILNLIKKHIVTLITTATTIVPILVYLDIDYSDFSQIVQANIKLFIIFFTIILSVLIMLIGILVDIKKNNSIKIDKSRTKHPILIFDDEKRCLRDIMNKLAGSQFDIVTVRDISDYRLAENFDIIIGDLKKVGPISSDNSIAVLNAIKEKYPYKVVIAMSSGVRPKSNELLVDHFISKENRDEYPEEIRRKIMEYSSQMDNIDNHWEATKVKLKAKGIHSEQIDRFKREYYTICRK